jgi:hypothetical protein
MIRAELGGWAEPEEKTCGRKIWSAPHSRFVMNTCGTPPWLLLRCDIQVKSALKKCEFRPFAAVRVKRV